MDNVTSAPPSGRSLCGSVILHRLSFCSSSSPEPSCCCCWTLSCAEVKMKRSLVICLLVCSSLVGLGSAIRCFSCKDYTSSCTKQRDCSYDDACLTLVERGGMTYRKCLKYTECERSRLAQMFPQVSSFTFRCCNSDLCNSAPSSAAGSVIGLLASVLVMWWCVH